MLLPCHLMCFIKCMNTTAQTEEARMECTPAGKILAMPMDARINEG